MTTRRSGSSASATARAPTRLALLCATAITTMLAGCADEITAPGGATGSEAPNAARFELAPATATLEWERTGRDLVVSHRVNPTNAARVYALLGVAQYGAVVAADDLDPDDGGRALYEARRGAIAGASAAVLTYLFADAQGALEDQVERNGAAGPGGTHPQFARGEVAGRAFGARMVAWGRSDGFSATWNGRAPDPVGGWVGLPGVAPAGFQFPTMKTYYLDSPWQFRPAPPPARGSAAFEADLAVVRDAARVRSPADVIFANVWNLNVGTVTALGYWNEVAAGYISTSGLDERAASHIFALMNSATMDAVIGCWDAKYHYVFLRPSMADPTISISPGVPGFPYGLPNHPSYPSGHSCVSAAAAHVITAYFPEHAATLAAQVADAGRSRVVGGIHYPFDVAAGQALGRSVADWAMAYDRRPGGLLAALVGR